MKNLKLAGVTFNNQDGTNRQGILAEFKAKNHDIIGCIVKKVNYTDAEGKDSLALAIFEKTTKQQIGFIPKENIPELLKTKTTELTGFIGYNAKGKCYYVELSPIVPPTRNQYRHVSRLCAENGIQAPAYDMRAYKRWFGMFAVVEEEDRKFRNK